MYILFSFNNLEFDLFKNTTAMYKPMHRHTDISFLINVNIVFEIELQLARSSPPIRNSLTSPNIYFENHFSILVMKERISLN